MKTRIAGLALGLAIASTAATAGQLDKLGSLGGLAGGGSSLTSGSAGNAAGIIQYCINNNYLGGNSGAAGVKDKLLGSLTGDQHAAGTDAGGASGTDMLGKLSAKPKDSTKSTAAGSQDKGYLDGAKGLLTTGDGKQVNLTGGDSSNSSDMKGQLVHKACDAVLKQGKKMAGM